MESPHDRKLLLIATGTASLAALVLAAAGRLSPPARAHDAALPAPASLARGALAGETQPISTPVPVAHPARSPAAPARSPDHAAPRPATDSRELSARYRQAWEDYSLLLDDCATREFDRGRYATHDAGTVDRVEGPGEIVSVRRAWEDRYRTAWLSRKDYPELYRAREDLVRLGRLLGEGAGPTSETD